MASENTSSVNTKGNGKMLYMASQVKNGAPGGQGAFHEPLPNEKRKVLTDSAKAKAKKKAKKVKASRKKNN
ncbi:MAG: hypothetical protein GQ570_13810 [Helicobacteraceae bacterium]|nr:hypothetical protein [Helicobacteraceae bacterium]